MTEPLLDVQNLHVKFETHEGESHVLNGVDICIDEGEAASLVGETGCGKSVTVKTILGLLPAARITKGEIRYRGENLLELSEKELHALRGNEISMIMQNPMSSLNPVFTIREQMVDQLKWAGKRRIGVLEWIRDKLGSETTEYQSRIIDMLNRVDIPAPEQVLSSYPHELSGGMRQRVLIAMAFLSEPSFLIADEPGTALDVTTESKVLDILNDLVEEMGATVLYITHDLGVAKEVSEHINVMYAGNIVESAQTADLFASPMHPYTRGLMDSIPKLSAGMGDGIEGHIPSYTNPPTGCRFANRCPYAEDICEAIFPYPRIASEEQVVGCHLYHGEPFHDRHHELYKQHSSDIHDQMEAPPWQ